MNLFPPSAKSPEDQRLLADLQQELGNLGRTSRLLAELLEQLEESTTPLTDNQLQALGFLAGDVRGASANFSKKLNQRLTPIAS